MATRFFIDYEWWQQSGKDIRVDIQQICSELGEDVLELGSEAETYDWIDPETAQVQPVSGVLYPFLRQCGSHPDFVNDRIPLTEAVFRALLAAGNRPMTPPELAARTGRPADTILRTLSGRQVYKGLRPIDE